MVIGFIRDATKIIVFNDLLQCLELPVVHVGCCPANFSQLWSSKPAMVAVFLCDGATAGVLWQSRVGCSDVMKTVVRKTGPLMADRTASPAKEQSHPILCT